MKIPAPFVWSAGLAALAVVAACSSFGADEPAATGPEAGVTPPGEGGTSAPDATNDAGDGGASSRWCATADAGFLCDDFDDPSLPAGSWAPWDRLDVFADGGAVRDPSLARSKPNAFLATASDASRHILQKNATLTEKHLTWDFDVAVDSLTAPRVVVAEVAFGPPGAVIVALKAEAGGSLSGSLDYAQVSTPLVMPPLVPKVGEWFHMRVEFRAKSGDDEYRVTVGEAASSAALSEAFPGTVVGLGLGARLDGPGTAAVRFDNVSMTLE